MDIPTKVLERASRSARNGKKWVYVWEDADEPEGYGIGDDEAADTFYLGQDPVATFGPDGGREA